MHRFQSAMIGLALSIGCTMAFGQALDTTFSCSAVADDGGEKITKADSGEIHLDGSRVTTFRWESAIYRATHGYDCNIDEDDGLQAEVRDESAGPAWRILLQDGRAARKKRGYNFERGVNCTIRLDRRGDSVKVTPSCPALCGSRLNFSDIAIDLKTGNCRYQ